MQMLIDYGLSIVVAIQSMGDWLIIPMRFFSYLGREEFFFLVLPLIYWSIDSSLGLRVAFILITSNMLNYIGKLAFAGPRPYWISSDIKALWSETSFGNPSAHAQDAMSVWGIIAARIHKTWVWIVAGAVIFLNGFSRLYLGAHFPHDVLIGWVIGGILLIAFLRYWEPAGAWLVKKTMFQQILFAFLVSILFISAGFSAAVMRKDFQVPEQWTSNALHAGIESPAPVDASGIFTSAGTLFGLAIGLAWIRQNGGYQASGAVWKRGLCYVVGLMGVLLFWMGLGAIFPRGDELVSYLLRYFRYILVGL